MLYGKLELNSRPLTVQGVQDGDVIDIKVFDELKQKKLTFTWNLNGVIGSEGMLGILEHLNLCSADL